jgi:hypothetical protein
MDPLIPIIPRQKVISWPKYLYGPAVPYLPLSAALTGTYSTDAHTAAYSAPDVPRRLCLDAVRSPQAIVDLDGGVDMVLAMFDVDRHDTGDVPTWWSAEHKKLRALLASHWNGFVYRTRGGYRIVYRIDPILIGSDADAALWTRRYLAWCVHLKKGFDIDCDPSCSEWVRLYRLPHATRDGSTEPENLPTLGDARNVGIWRPELSEYDWVLADSFKPTKRREYQPRAHSTAAGDGVLFYAFRARGWVGQAVSPGKWSVTCPWESSHSKGDRFNTSTILYAPGHGEKLGWLKCSHAHCQGRTMKDLLSQFSEYEIERAEVCAGVR